MSDNGWFDLPSLKIERYTAEDGEPRISFSGHIGFGTLLVSIAVLIWIYRT